MTKTFILFLIFFETACTSYPPLSAEKDAVAYEISYEIREGRKNELTLKINLKLQKGSYVISPHSRDTIYGHITLSLDDNSFLEKKGDMKESPMSTKEFDPIIKGDVHFIREDTKFEQSYLLKNAEDFKVKGNLWFVLEPECAPYDNHFEIIKKDGNVSIKKLGSSYSEGYKK